MKHQLMAGHRYAHVMRITANEVQFLSFSISYGAMNEREIVKT